MEHVSTYVLLVITLLQLCRAEVTGSWYSANVINDGDFSPKPLSEIFSTEPPPPFSSSNPIVVAHSTTPSTPISTSVQPGSSSSYATPSITPEFISTYSTPPSTFQTQSSYLPSSLPPQQYSQSTLPEPQPTFDLGPKLTFGLGQQPWPMNFNIDKQNPNAPNYFMIYQQAQNLPQGPQQSFSTYQPSSTFQPELSTPQSTFSTYQPELSTPQSTFSTFRPELSTPQSTFSTFRPELSTPQSTFSTFRPELSTPQSTFSTFKPEISTTPTTLIFTPSSESTLPPSLATSPRPSSPRSTQPPKVVKTTAGTAIPCKNTAPANANPLARYPTLRIRMIAPSGSITNVNINPPTTTKRTTTRRTTTRKPTTTRTRRTKKNRNTFDGCVRTCEDRGKNPICAAPLAQIPVNPNTLKGFPSVCHMACHNSFKRDQYEMVVQGRCGRLRTRIKTMDSDKLKRVELNKAQYTVVNGPETILEFSSLPR